MQQHVGWIPIIKKAMHKAEQSAHGQPDTTRPTKQELYA